MNYQMLKLIETYPLKIPTTKVAKYLGMDIECLRRAIEQNKIPFEPKDIDKFYAHINDTLCPYEDADLNKFSSNELVEVYYELESKLMKRWQAPLVNDFYAMIFYGLLKKQLLKLAI